MPIQPDDISVGKEYITRTGEVRKVLEHENGMVTYEIRVPEITFARYVDKIRPGSAAPETEISDPKQSKNDK